jgi:hypothetical protein
MFVKKLVGGESIGKKPFYQDEEGNIHIASFKNKNKKGVKYIKSQITMRTFPFDKVQRLFISEPELERLRILLNRKPKFQPK